jgi:hypothetical protein
MQRKQSALVHKCLAVLASSFLAGLLLGCAGLLLHLGFSD